METIKIALAKGRLADLSLELLEQIGISFSSYYEKTRKLTFISDDGNYELILVKAMDVGTYVENGAADIGVAGKDTLLEAGADVFEVIDLGFGRCEFAVAGQPGTELSAHQPLTIGTKYPKITNDYFQAQGRQVETIKLNGSVELAPLVGLSDVIVDIVETGSTLKENNLEVIETMLSISARLVVNKASFKTKGTAIRPVIDQVKSIVDEKGRVTNGN
ncbi:ATP phosphoribosyltransferase [Alkalibacillus almallahensis]|uniref:ATP phosphoribosyltransferase n=1 Tax=Alkalibacillus almallahensis TaxID=1379154 RepID=UPI001422636D|nr:ATP phosphoribosyltransferase [Alkalibacillus almallahensis]NIK11975.1 ATP phosphoribosyltransferase [Alkalibacillus almallahensis]